MSSLKELLLQFKPKLEAKLPVYLSSKEHQDLCLEIYEPLVTFWVTKTPEILVKVLSSVSTDEHASQQTIYYKTLIDEALLAQYSDHSSLLFVARTLLYILANEDFKGDSFSFKAIESEGLYYIAKRIIPQS